MASSEQKLEERNVFEAFRNACSGFSCTEWYLPEHDPPDVIYVDDSGRHIGVEICQWAHQEEMKAGKLRERVVQKNPGRHRGAAAGEHVEKLLVGRILSEIESTPHAG